VVGWGIEKDVKVGPNKVADVPYWLCRNSWGTKWGEKGYWKHAMFPFNKFSAFEKVVVIVDNVSRKLGGGIFAFSIGKIEPLKNSKKMNIPAGQELNKNEDFYKADRPMEKLECAGGSGGGGGGEDESGDEEQNEGKGKGKEAEEEERKKRMNTILIVGLILFVLFVIILAFFLN
jgi:hypothetical protein